MRSVILLTLIFLCSAAHAEFPPDRPDNTDEDVNAAIDAKPDAKQDNDQERMDSDSDRDKNNPFSGKPEELNSGERLLSPRTNRQKKKKKKPAPSKQIQTERELDDDEDPLAENDEEAISPMRRSRSGIRLGVYAGISSMSNDDPSVESQRGQEGLSTTYPIGIDFDAHAFRFFGAELDGYYSIGLTQNVYNANSGSSGVTSASKSIQPYGADALLKVRYPFDKGTSQWFPEIGAGYGYHGLKYSAAAGSSTETDTMAAAGPEGFAGLEIIPNPNFRLNLDFLMSITAPGTILQDLASGPGQDQSGNGTFTRLRLAGYYQIGPGFFIGAMLIRRTLSLNVGQTTPSTSQVGGTPTAPTGATESQIQIMLTAQYEF